MNILIVGGTGFLGWHAAQEFLRRGHRISVLALPPIPVEGLLPAGTQVHLADLCQLSDSAVRALLEGSDGVVFAAGADDRVVPPAPAYPFFHRANVEACVRLFRLAREAGVQRGVLLGSYFAHFDRIWPELKLAERHPYIRSRREQEEQSLLATMPHLQLVILELPYVFGSMPGRVPLWSPLIQYVRSSRVLLYPKGGANMIAVQHVGEAIVGAIERGRGGERYLVGDENLKWTDFLSRLSLLAAGKRKPVITIPTFLFRLKMQSVARRHKSSGKESGLDPAAFTQLMTANTFFDPGPSRRALGYGQGGLDGALRDTVEACPHDLQTSFW
jgi:nucleoside-diphosphate-sugar epimerase